MSDSILLQAYMCIEITHGPQGSVQRGKYCHHMISRLIYSVRFPHIMLQHSPACSDF